MAVIKNRTDAYNQEMEALQKLQDKIQLRLSEEAGTVLVTANMPDSNANAHPCHAIVSAVDPLGVSCCAGSMTTDNMDTDDLPTGQDALQEQLHQVQQELSR